MVWLIFDGVWAGFRDLFLVTTSTSLSLQAYMGAGRGGGGGGGAQEAPKNGTSTCMRAEIIISLYT